MASPNLELLGNLDVPRLPIISFRIRHGDRLLHHELVVAMLNDLFGIQARGGCSCAGPYGHRLLGIGPERARDLSEQAGRGWFGIKPGWVRISFNYFITDTEADFLIEAVDLLAWHGHRLLGDYAFDPRTGQWRHHRAPVYLALSLAALLDGRPGPGTVASEAALAGYLERPGPAGRPPGRRRPRTGGRGPSGLPPELERLRNFSLPPLPV